MPSDWLSIQLGDIIDVRHGFAFKGEYFTSGPGPIVMTPGNFRDDGGFKYKSPEKCYSGPIPEAYVLAPGSLLVAMTEQKRGLLGSAALVPSTGIFLHNQRLGLIVERDLTAVCRRFLYYLFNTAAVRDQIQATANGAKVRHTSPTRLKEVKVSLPPVTAQRRIAAVLAAYDELIENNLRRIEILEEMAQAVYREWFVDFRFPGHEDVPLVDSPLGPIPDGWAVRTVAHLSGGTEGVVGGPFGSKLGRKDYVSSGVPVIRGTNLNGSLGWSDDEFVFVSAEKLEELRGNIAKPGDIVVTQRGTLGQVGLIPASSPWPEFVVSQSQMRVRVDPSVSTPLFVYHTLRWPSTNQRLVDHAMSSGVPHINLGILRDFRAVAPSPDVAAAFDEVVRPTRRLAENLSRQNINVRSTRDLLLGKLVSGGIDVSDLDIDTNWLSS